MHEVCKTALRIRAARRNRRLGIGSSPPTTEPTIVRKHVDGPYLRALDGSLLWLTPWERLLTKLGIWGAWDIEWRRFSRLLRDKSDDFDPDAETGCADDITFANVSADDLRAAITRTKDKSDD